MHADLQQLLAPDVLPDVTAVPLEDLRAFRTSCSAAESDVSFIRRVAQGRLDIVGYEVRRRSESGESASGGTEPDTAGLLFDLPDILTDAVSGSHAPSGRSVAIHEPGVLAQKLVVDLDTAASPGELASLDDLDSDRLALLMDALRSFEVDLSATRRRLHERIDSIQNEIARRYRDGEASIDSLLN